MAQGSSPGTTNTRRNRSPWRIVGVVAALVVALVIVLGVVVAVFGLRIASGIVRDQAAQAAGREIQGDVAIGDVDLSWRGPQRLNNVVLTDPEGNVVADLTVVATSGVLPVIFGERDFGEIRVSGRMNIVREEGEQQTTLAQAIEPAPSEPGRPEPTGGPSRLPEGLAARLVVDNVKVSYIDRRADAAASTVDATLSGEAAMRVGAPATIALVADANVDGRPARATLDLRVENYSTPQGQLTVEQAVANGVLSGEAPVGFIAAIPGVGEWIDLDALQATPQDLARINARIAGDASRATATLQLDAPGLLTDLDLEATLAGDHPRIRLAEPGAASITITPRMAARAQGENATVSLASPATVRASIDAFEMPMPVEGAIDLRTAVLRASISAEDLEGVATIPGEDRTRRFALRGLSARVDSSDLAERVVVEADARMTLDGEDAGALRVDMVAAELARADGAPRGLPADLRGVASITGLATELLQPFVQDAGLALREDIGPTIDVAVRAESAPSDDAGAAPTLLVVSANAQNLDARGEFAVTPDRIISRSEGFHATLRNSTPAIARMLADSGVTATVRDRVTLALTDVDIPIVDGSMQLHEAAARASISTGGVDMVLPQGEPLSLTRLEAGATLTPGEPPRAGALIETGDGSMNAVADFRLVNLFSADGSVQTERVRPIGTLRVRDLPVALVRLAGLQEYAELAEAAAGERLTLTATTTEAPNDSVSAEVVIEGQRLNATAAAMLSASAIDVRQARANILATPALVGRAVAQFAPELTPAPTLAMDTPLTIELEPVTIPATGWGQPNLAAAGEAAATLRAGGDLVVLNATTLDDAQVDIGLRSLEGRAVYDLARNEASAVGLRAGLFEPRDPQNLVATVFADVNLEGNQPTQGVVELRNLQTARADVILQQPGLIEGSLGPAADIRVTIEPTGAWPPEKGAGMAPGAFVAEAAVQSEKLNTTAAVRVDDRAITLLRPADIRWTMPPEWATEHLLGDNTEARLTAPTLLEARVQRLTISRAEGPFMPGIFEVQAQARTPSVSLVTSKGENIEIREAAIDLRQADAPGALAFNGTISQIQGRAGSGSLMARGQVRHIADERGALTTDDAIIDVTAEGQLPSALLDIVADTDTLIQDLLGAAVNAKLTASDLSRTSGVLAAEAHSPRADAKVRGDVRDGAFVIAEPATAQLHEITREFSAAAIEPLIPFLARFEKRAEDAPATVTVTNLRAPLEKTQDTDGDGVPDKVSLRGLDADIRMELGPVRYTTSDFFGAILKFTKNDAEGRIFHNFPPLVVQVRNGVATYDRTRFPIGEFVVETSGAIDLAAKTMDLVVWVPLAALVTEVAGAFQKVPGLDVMTLTPFRLRGPLGSVRPEPALDLFLKDVATEAPRRIIEEGIGGALEKIFGGDKNRKNNNGGQPK